MLPLILSQTIWLKNLGKKEKKKDKREDKEGEMTEKTEEMIEVKEEVIEIKVDTLEGIDKREIPEVVREDVEETENDCYVYEKYDSHLNIIKFNFSASQNTNEYDTILLQ